MKDQGRTENNTGEAQETSRCSDIDSIAAMTREEVLSGLRQYGIKPTKELPQQLRRFLPVQPSLSKFRVLKPTPAFRDEQLYAFIVARASRSRSFIRRFSVHKRWLKASALAAALVFCATAYGVYGLTQQAARARVEEENNRLRLENERQRQKLQKLANRVDAIEDAARRLSEISDMPEQASTDEVPSRQGGPQIKVSATNITALELRTVQLQRQLEQYEQLIGDRSHAPSTWPVVAPAEGTVIQAGWKNGYGQTVVIDHGHGLTTRYGHLSKIEVTAGQSIRRGEELGQVGPTGRSTGPHLHYEVRLDEVAVNPKQPPPTSIN